MVYMSRVRSNLRISYPAQLTYGSRIYGSPIQLNSHMGRVWLNRCIVFICFMSLVEFGELYLYVSCLIKKLGFINHLSTFLNNKLF